MKFLNFALIFCTIAICGEYCIQPSFAGESRAISLYKNVGSRQCEGPLATKVGLQKEIELLKKAGVHVESAQCGNDSNMYPAVCGGPTGEIWLISVKPESVTLAKSAGYKVVQGQPVQAQKCRQ